MLFRSVRQGKALYVGLSNYDAEKTRAAVAILNQLGTPCLIHQPKYNMFHRLPETTGLLTALDELGVGCIPFSPLAQGQLTDRYLNGIPADSRAASASPFLKGEQITPETIAKVKALNQLAKERGQTLSEMSLAWLLRDQGAEGRGQVTSVIIGASKPRQIVDNVAAIKNLEFSGEELLKIESVLAS